MRFSISVFLFLFYALDMLEIKALKLMNGRLNCCITDKYIKFLSNISKALNDFYKLNEKCLKINDEPLDQFEDLKS
jgi:hypothetical protein